MQCLCWGSNPHPLDLESSTLPLSHSSKINFFKIYFPEYHQSIRQLGSRSGRIFCGAWSGSKIVSMIRKYHNHKPQTTPQQQEEEPLNHHETPGRQTKQSKQLPLPRQDDCNTRMDIKVQQNIEQLQTPTMGVTINKSQLQQNHCLRIIKKTSTWAKVGPATGNHQAPTHWLKLYVRAVIESKTDCKDYKKLTPACKGYSWCSKISKTSCLPKRHGQSRPRSKFSVCYSDKHFVNPSANNTHFMWE